MHGTLTGVEKAGYYLQQVFATEFTRMLLTAVKYL